MSRSMRRCGAFLSLFLAACASSANVVPERDTHSVRQLDTPAGTFRVESNSVDATVTAAAPVSVEEAWKALPAVYTRLGLVGGVLDEAGWAYGQRQSIVRRRLAGTPISTYLDCGASTPGVSNADTYTVTLAVVTRVQAGPAGGGSRISTRVEAQARSPGGSDQPVRCTSNNVLERRILEMLSAR
ncbi:MAG: hypothetical protein JO040_04130 [Gemmatimonadetes bacterium]|nr:hypothetical protein [Gemmatimonadota bacterium]